MTKIRILPEILANKIAAGEVVERPASVVKELVENALDAGSTRIMIEVQNGGRALIQVADNGTGMSRDDALLALERFATSKIRTDSDLFAIQTLGFRGEALPSIAAVSKLTLVTREPAAHSGVEVQVHGGKIIQVTDAGAAPGTIISVAQLFYNTPARRKFLKSVVTEMGHIADIVAGMALGNPQVHFKLIHNGKSVKQWSRVSDPAERAADVLGQVTRQELIALHSDDSAVKITGYLGPARLARSTSRGIYLYVNGRRVRDRMVQHALFEGFHGRLMKGQFPLAVLFLQLPFDHVDVNVHPTKHEVRFVHQQRVHHTVRDLVATTLARADRRLWTTSPAEQAPSAATLAEPGATYGRRPEPRWASSSKAASVPVQFHPAPADVPVESSEPVSPLAMDQQPLWSAQCFADLTVIGQFRGTYLICQAEQELILIDQHAAHERIVYEQLQQRAGQIESQRLLMPETVELGFTEAHMLEQLIPQLNEMGLEIEPFGGNTFVVKAVPALLDDRDISRIIVELAEKAAEIGWDAGVDKIMDACRMVMACHNAVRANQRLADQQIRHMLRQLDQCRIPSHCPHGRPTWIRWSLKDLEKAFGRMG